MFRQRHWLCFDQPQRHGPGRRAFNERGGCGIHQFALAATVDSLCVGPGGHAADPLPWTVTTSNEVVVVTNQAGQFYDIIVDNHYCFGRTPGAAN
jgi:hypothetical protein